MRYRPEILALYADLFGDAHETLQKEAGLFSRMGKAVQSGVKGFGKGVAEALPPSKAKMLERELAASKDVNEGLSKAVQGLELDAGTLQSQLNAAKQNFAKTYGIKASPEALEEAGRSKKLWQGLGLGSLGTAAVGIPTAHYLGQQEGEADKDQTRNVAFGVGAASGLAAPHVIRGLGRIAKGVEGAGLLPGFQNMSNTPGRGY